MILKEKNPGRLNVNNIYYYLFDNILYMNSKRESYNFSQSIGNVT